ncbi:MAG: hypothetical protein P4L86_28845 [Mycobacterium sp.]|nr:hypothetical protein [Mycobacterium sp.]
MAAGVAAGLGVAPIASADTCDPVATICQGSDIDDDSAPLVASPSVVANDQQYPFGEDWYFDPAGGGTMLNPVEPVHPGGGGHR